MVAHSSILHVQVKSENRQNKNKVHQLENEIQLLREKIRSMEEIQGLADQQLQEADEEKEAILAQLEDLEKRVGIDMSVCSVLGCSGKEHLKNS